VILSEHTKEMNENEMPMWSAPPGLIRRPVLMADEDDEAMALLVACGLSVAATFALMTDIADTGPRRAIITVCLVVAAAPRYSGVA